MTRHNQYRAVLLCGATLLFAGCNKQDNSKANFQSAINDYYKAHPACIWQDTKKFPVQAATSDDAKTQGYDALTDAGLLTRTTGEKKVFIVASKQVNNYDLSAQGRSAWTPDTSQPGYGNFCYGHRAGRFHRQLYHRGQRFRIEDGRGELPLQLRRRPGLGKVPGGANSVLLSRRRTGAQPARPGFAGDERLPIGRCPSKWFKMATAEPTPGQTAATSVR